ncbi:NIF3-like protein 1, partial [Myxocyprinus asiaticus]|uniref:NIF3-like protein 1 n=1 Tax=Myxocyprinus asiaticus TaxID=70543 RepID=UPI00222382EC
TSPTGHMDLKGVLEVLEQLVPLLLAESWDNVSLLVEPNKPRPIKTILPTNDLTVAVMDKDEAINCDLIISYHPVNFDPLIKSLEKLASIEITSQVSSVSSSDISSTVETVAVCAGCGASFIQGVKAEFYITGEMSHHEVLDAVSKGTSVMLSEHSNSEEGFLAIFKERLKVRLGDTVTVAISQIDRDPLQVV